MSQNYDNFSLEIFMREFKNSIHKSRHENPSDIAYQMFQKGNFNSLYDWHKFERDNPALDYKDSSFFTWACAGKSLGVVKAIFETYKPFPLGDDQISKGLSLATTNMNKSICEYLIRDLKFDIKPYSNALLIEVTHTSYQNKDGKNIELLKLFIDNGIDVNKLNMQRKEDFEPEIFDWLQEYKKAKNLNDKLKKELPVKNNEKSIGIKKKV